MLQQPAINFVNRYNLEFATTRVTQPTKSYLSRLDTRPHRPLLAPLFPITSWTCEQVEVDQRLQLENSLRAQGLLRSDYARLQIKQTEPPGRPRRDVVSTIKI